MLLHAHLSIRHVIRISASVFDDFIFDLLHEVKELLEGDSSGAVWVKFVNEFSNFVCVTLQTSHDGLKVFDFNGTATVRIEHFEDGAEVLDLVFGKIVVQRALDDAIVWVSALHLITRLLLLRHLIVRVINACHSLLTRHGFSPRERRP